MRGRSKSPVAGRRSSGSPARPVAWPPVGIGGGIRDSEYEIWGMSGPPRFATWGYEGVAEPEYLPIPPVKEKVLSRRVGRGPTVTIQEYVEDESPEPPEEAVKPPPVPSITALISDLETLQCTLRTRLTLLPSPANTPPATPLPSITPGSPLFTDSPPNKKTMSRITPTDDMSLTERFKMLREQLYA
eukprot:TRINITY_DN47331_c0_g1_i1.p1 TRINITY_DN47331_c0_g1~~TRINITY_DN47331_c0_g1_i1.p1  ORF type:complete len:195 (+),score=4.35 TRINITY_DN47331_c0_g1_i1:25-585(+)